MLCYAECGKEARFLVSESLGVLEHKPAAMLYLPLCDDCAANAEEQGYVPRMLPRSA